MNPQVGAECGVPYLTAATPSDQPICEDVDPATALKRSATARLFRPPSPKHTVRRELHQRPAPGSPWTLHLVGCRYQECSTNSCRPSSMNLIDTSCSGRRLSTDGRARRCSRYRRISRYTTGFDCATRSRAANSPRTYAETFQFIQLIFERSHHPINCRWCWWPSL
jgi:hypothetical protein